MKNTTRLLLLIVVTFLMSCHSKDKETKTEKTVLTDMSSLEDQVKESPIKRASEAPLPPMKSTVKFIAPVITDEPIEEGEDMQSQNAAPANNAVVDKKKIIKDGSISIKTNDIAACKKSVEALVKQLGGYFDSENLQNEDEQISYYLKARIPAQHFDAMLTGLEKGKDEIKSKNIQARDVTEEYMDVVTRLANKKLYLNRYKELLTKASTVRDILAIEEQIRNIQEEIESKEGRLKYMDDQVTFSTLDINLFKLKEYVYKPQDRDKFSERLKNALSDGWRGINNFVLWMIRLWPFILLVLAIVYGIKWRKHSVRKSKISKE